MRKQFKETAFKAKQGLHNLIMIAFTQKALKAMQQSHKHI